MPLNAGSVGPGIGGSGGGGGGSGTVTSVSVTSANGLAGTVANPTTTPAITLTTSVTGLLKGNGTAISAATAGTDYLAPGGSGAITSALTLSTITADPAPAVVGTYYRCNYTGNLTLPTSPATGSWIMAKTIGAHTLTVVGTVDGVTNPTQAQNVNTWMIYNGTNWDFI